MDISNLSDRERRALAAIKYQGFGPWRAGERDELLAALAEKGLVGPGYGVAALTAAGEAALKAFHIEHLCTSSEDWTPFQQEWALAVNGMDREWVEAERARMN